MTIVLAHGLGGSTDLPIPFTYVLIGATWALAVSFAVLAFAWRTPKLDPDSPGHSLPIWVTRFADSPVTRNVLSALALLFTIWVGVAAFFGPAESTANALPGVFYVVLWVGLVVVSLAVGPIWRVLSPVRTMHRLVCAARGRPTSAGNSRYRTSWGYRPAVLGLFAFVWLELAWDDPGSVAAVRTWCVVYLVVTSAGAFVFGERWCERGDPFEVYSTLASKLSPLSRRRDDGRIVLRNPLDHLGSMPVRAGSVALMATLLGSTAFDSFSAFPWWSRTVDGFDGAAATLARTAGLLTFICFVGVSFWLAARATGGLSGRQRAGLPGQLSHSLIPIVIGYVFAHYLTYLVEKGQATAILLADPLGRGWNVLGLGNAEVAYVLSEHPGATASIKVLCVVTGHILGVIAAHDKSVSVLPRNHQLTGQLALLLTMVTYTFGGLYLLFGG
ncbi:MAG: hypothetical protein WAW17_14750 [Rhodococcus sp. (in: high G+C Gram-positive bacteria)]|uniref:hypothetical protein n=1 Tax=Rhodococcus sp. TaxID=1831 RepID=UPI003BAFEF85